MTGPYEKLYRFLKEHDLDSTRPVVCTVHRQRAPCMRRDRDCQFSDNPVTVADICGEEE